MPIYEYRCDTCGNIFEEWHRHADDVTEQACPECREAAHRLISSTTFILKGGGWYATEYGNHKTDTVAEAPASASSPVTETQTETKVESTPSAAPAVKAEASAASHSTAHP